MRRVVWSVLTGLGVFFIVLAAMSRLYVPGQAVKFPLNEYGINTLVATNAGWFSPKSVSELKPVTLVVTSTVKGNLAAADSLGSSNIAVWQSFAAIEDTTDHQQVDIPAAADELAFNRRTGVIVPWRGNEVDGKAVPTASGQAYAWPLGAKKQNYQVYNTTLLKPITFRYKTTATTDGIPTYEYVATIPSTQVGTQSLPGSLVGMSAPEVTLPEFYSATETFYVDPVTGAPLSVIEDTNTVLKDSAGTTRLVLLSGDFTSSAASVASTIKSDNHYRDEISLATTIVPIVALLLGIILVVVGLVLSRMRPEDEEYEDEDEPVSSPV
jgi:Porin PorA